MAHTVLFIFSPVLNSIFYLAPDVIYKDLTVYQVSLRKLFKFKPGNGFDYLVLSFILYIPVTDNVLK